MNSRLQGLFCRRFAILSCSLLVLWSCSLLAAPGNKPAASSKPVAKADASESEIPLSVFNIPGSPKEGKDPFFPNRLPANTVKPGPGRVTPTPAPIALILNGLSGTTNKPLAIINNYTFAKGEEADIRAGTGRVHVRCLDIKDDSVLIEVNGVKQELRLRLGMR